MFKKKDKEFVVPGDEIVKSIDYLPGKNCYREGESIIAKRLGIVSVSNRVVSVIPLNSVYIPKAGDMVIGEVIDTQPNGWILDIHSVGSAFLPLSGVREYIDPSKIKLTKIYGIGEILYAKVYVVNDLDSVHLSMQDIKCRKLRDGRILRLNPAKIPRLIGRQGSMIMMIKEKTRSRIYVGQNGLVWVQDGNDGLVIKALELIDREPYADGLTDKVSKLLEAG
jgi:exosome complex component RRP4